MADLIATSEAYAELDALYEVDEDAAAQFEMLLETLSDNTSMLDRLFRPANHFQYQPPFEIKRFGELQNVGKNIYIIKVRHATEGYLLPYRLLLGYHAQIDTFYVLSLIEREIDYAPRDPTIVAALERYDGCGIPTYPH
jgi:hypothetical protein